FYEQLVRANAPRCAASSLRTFEIRLGTKPAERPPRTRGAPNPPQEISAHWRHGPLASGSGPSLAEMGEETGEQFPSLVDQTRLAASPADRPKLVAGLAALLLKHADAGDIEQELLRRPEFYGFRGTLEQRLMEFLYLGEKNLRIALGPALFKAKDLRRMAE